jgi:hypothetical protein
MDDEDLDDFTYSQTMLSLINSMQPNHVKIDLDLVPQNKNNDSNKGNIIIIQGEEENQFSGSCGFIQGGQGETPGVSTRARHRDFFVTGFF